MKNANTRRTRKPLEELNVIDDFLFFEIMSDQEKGTELCRMILSRVLRQNISRLEYTPQRAVPGVSESTHGIRMDAYITEFSDDEISNIRVFDVEPDNKSYHKASLPKRSRYYTDLIDVKLLETGTDYENLPELITIFILSYDPFGEDALYYEAGSVIKTHPNVEYNDGIRRIYLYVGGMLPEGAGEEEKNLQNLLMYIGNSSKENIKNEEIRKLDEIVSKTKADKNVGIRYMKSWELEDEIRKEGREEGRREGREEGRREGREEERKNTEAERKRTEAERKKAESERRRAEKAEAELAMYKAKFGE